MAPSKRPAAIKPVVPAVPRIFETKKKAPSEPVNTPIKSAQVEPEAQMQEQEQEQDEKAHDSEFKLEEKPASPTNKAQDWASMIAEDDEIEQISLRNKSLNITETPKNNGLAETDADNQMEPNTPASSQPLSPEQASILTPKQIEPVELRPTTNGHQQAPAVIQTNGHPPMMPGRPQAPAYPPGFGPIHRRAVHNIAFGSFGEIAGSERSSPTLPPSATSTQFTHPTPLSDTHSQSSRAGPSNGPPDRPAEHPAARHLAHHGHTHHSKSFDQRRNGVNILRHASGKFNEENRDQLLKAVGQDFFAVGGSELSLSVVTHDGRNSFNIPRAICRRSPVLSRLLEQPAGETANGTHPRTEELHFMSPFITTDSVKAVLQSLYGIPILSREILDGHETLHFKKPLDMIATGYQLGAGLVIAYGTDLALKLMGWESLAANFQFCLEQTHIDYGDGRSPELVNLANLVSYGRQEYVPILAQSLDCIIREINTDEGFRFSEHAAYFPELGGSFHAAPASVELSGYTPNSNPTHGPSRIQFGSMSNFYRHKHQTLSSILLSLPLIVLQHVLAHVFNLNIVKEVIDERDKRRVFALNAGPMTYLAHYQESLVPTPEFNGMRVISKRVF